MPEHDDGVNDESLVHHKNDSARDKRMQRYGDWEESPPEHLVKAEEKKAEADKKLFEAEIDEKQAWERKQRVERSQYVTQKSGKGASPFMSWGDVRLPVCVGVALAVAVGLLAKDWWLGPLWGGAIAAGWTAALSDRRRRREFEATIVELGEANDFLQMDCDRLFEASLALKKQSAVFQQAHDFSQGMNTAGVEVLLGGVAPLGPQAAAKLRFPADTLHKHLVDAAVEGFHDAIRLTGAPEASVEEAQNVRTDYEERFWDWIKDMMSGKR